MAQVTCFSNSTESRASRRTTSTKTRSMFRPLASASPTRARAARACGSGGGKANIQDLHFTKVVDKASPNLFLACATGKHIPNGDGALFGTRRAKSHTNISIIDLTEVFVSSVSTSGHDGGGIAQESVSLNFSKVEVNYTPQKADGTPGAKNAKTFDVKANKGS